MVDDRIEKQNKETTNRGKSFKIYIISCAAEVSVAVAKCYSNIHNTESKWDTKSLTDF